MTDGPRVACLAAFLMGVLLPTGVHAGDEDENPAYMIYIDPETGKYTTEDPDESNPSESDVTVVPVTNDRESNLPLLVLAGGAIGAVLIGGLLKHQHRKAL